MSTQPTARPTFTAGELTVIIEALECVDLAVFAAITNTNQSPPRPWRVGELCGLVHYIRRTRDQLLGRDHHPSANTWTESMREQYEASHEYGDEPTDDDAAADIAELLENAVELKKGEL